MRSLPCNNKLQTLGDFEETLEDAVNPAAVRAAMASGLEELATLMMPVFYQDKRHTLFVEPEVAEQTIEATPGWVTPTPHPDPGWQSPDWWKNLSVVASDPRRLSNFESGDRNPGVEISAGSLIKPKPAYDWLVNRTTMLEFESALIGPSGQPGLEIRSGAATADVAPSGMT